MANNPFNYNTASPVDKQKFLDNLNGPTMINSQGGVLTQDSLGNFTVGGNGRAVGTTAENAVKTTYNSDLKNKQWAF